MRKIISIGVALSLISPIGKAAENPVKTTLEDGAYLATSPLRLRKKDFPAGACVVGSIGGLALLDRTLRNHLYPFRNNDPSEDLRRLGDAAQVAGPVIGTVFAIHGAATGNAKSKETALLGYESYIWAGAIEGALKFATGRKRPSDTENPFHFKLGGSDSSFPSGHTTEAFAAATVFTEQYPHWWVAVPAFGAAATQGFSRMYANKHWLSDVAAGALLGMTVSHTLRKRHRQTGESHWSYGISPNGVVLSRAF
jgi:hypothetical protein